MIQQAKILEEQGFITKLNYEDFKHQDFLILSEKIKKIKLDLKRKIQKKQKAKECTFKPKIRSKINYRNSIKKRVETLKIQVRISKTKTDILYVYPGEDIWDKINAMSRKNDLNSRKSKKLLRMIQKHLN